VLLAETLRFLRNGPGLYLDATLGDGGHAEALLSAEPAARLLGSDRDPGSLEHARRRLAGFGDRVSLAHATFRELPEVHRAHRGEPFAGALLDLGLSSRQLDDPARGMSFMAEGPLDLRMDPTRGESAAALLARVEEAELARALREHGDLRESARLARTIAAEARGGGLTTTGALKRAIARALGGKPHPRRLAQVFQALRIWINDEAAELEAALGWLPSVVRPGGVVVTLAYHSGEDRRIKQALRGTRPVPSRRHPLPDEARLREEPWEELNARVVTPTQEEVTRNPRARSARLRAFRRRTA
jgi:16S rRNA (cytosine1402-N4)-methyltransferase